jgi:hypothetical protein
VQEPWKKGYRTVKFAFQFPETVKPTAATKIAAKGCVSTNKMMGICQANEQNKKS